jgi:hypothetical protein
MVVGGVDSCVHTKCNCHQDTNPAIWQVMLAVQVLGVLEVAM